MDGRVSAGIVVTGFPRAGTTLLYCMLRHCVRGFAFDEREHWRLCDGRIIKSPRAVFHALPAERCIVLLRDPRALLTSRHPAYPDQYFVSAHHCANDQRRGLCEWWTAIKRVAGDALLLRYEDVVARPRQVQAAIGTAFGLTYADEFTNFSAVRHGDYWERTLGGLRALACRDVSDTSRIERIEREYAAFPELRAVSEQMGYA